jgi:multicomponent Na+:H+ antiporter subunit E
VALFGFWVVLSGKLDAFHLGAGLVTSLAVGAISCRLFALEPFIGRAGRHPFATMPWMRIVLYLPWLFGQIIIASGQVARIVLSPKLTIRPVMFRFKQPLPNNIARTTLANSITLTPGTVTIDVLGDEYLVHALTDEARASLETDESGNMKQRVEAVFRERGA